MIMNRRTYQDGNRELINRLKLVIRILESFINFLALTKAVALVNFHVSILIPALLIPGSRF